MKPIENKKIETTYNTAWNQNNKRNIQNYPQ